MGKSVSDLCEIIWSDLITAIDGYFAGQRDETIRVRQLAWVTYRGYCDPKSGINDIERFWPIETAGKPAYKAPTKKTLIKYDKMFRSLTKNLK